jgi:teichuronic acid biosynthesis glycosyltransferase TuaC
MRIAIVTTSYPKDEADASGHFVRAEARAWSREGHEVVVFAPDGRGLLDGIDVIGGSSYGAFGWPGAASRLRERPHRAVGATSWMLHARAALRHAGPFDRVIAHWAVPTAWPLVGEEHGALSVVSHGGDVRLIAGLPRPLREHVVSSIARRATSWRFVSAPLRDRLLGSVSGGLATRVEAIASVDPCAFELPDVRARATELRATSKAPLVCSVGRLVPKKRIDRVVAFAAREHMGKQLIVVGDGPERPRLERMAALEKLDARFMGTLPRDEALAWIAASEVLLFASEAEGCSTVLREAEALGVRVERVA